MAGGHPHRGAAGMGVLEPEHADEGVHTVKGVGVGQQSLNGPRGHLHGKQAQNKTLEPKSGEEGMQAGKGCHIPEN